jgi:hypothetical protein
MDSSVLVSSIKSLERSADSLAVWLTIFTTLVVIGLILEYRKDVLGLFRSFEWAKLWAVTGGIFVTVGVAGELFVEFRASNIEGQLRTANASLVSGLNKEAEDERLERTKLEAQIAPRRLTPAQRKAIAEAVKPFTGRSVSVASFAIDMEGAQVALQIIAALKDGGLNVQNDATLCVQFTGGIASGIFVRGTERDLVTALREILKLQGGLSDVEMSDAPVPCERFGRAALKVDIVVGVKPVK